MREIKLTQGKVALVDDDDYERVNQFKWYAKKGGYTYYAVRAIPSHKSLLLHRFIMGTPDHMEVDHVDHNGLNCQKYNMRNCTKNDNLINSKRKKSKYKGVCKQGRAKTFYASISFNNTKIYIGSFKNEIDAAKAYDKKAKELYGEFAYLNF